MLDPTSPTSPWHTLVALAAITSLLGACAEPEETQDDPPAADMSAEVTRDLGTLPEDQGITPGPDQGAPEDMSALPEDMSSPEPDMGSSEPDMRPEDMGAPEDMDPPVTGPIDRDVRNYIFGHSLILHSETANTPRWLHALASQAGYTYAMSGQYGFASTHADNLPPFAQWGIPGVPSAWDDDSGLSFGDADFDTVLFTEANFVQYVHPERTDPDIPNARSSVSLTLDVFDWVEREEPGTRLIVYENWPDMAPYTNADFSSSFPTQQELTAYYDDTRGSFHDWWVDYHDALMRERPGLEIHMIPVGPIMVKLLSGTLSDVPADALYEDNAPHGLPTLYFLAGLITYMGIYGEPAPMAYAAPMDVHDRVRSRYAVLVNEIWAELDAFDDASGSSRVWPR